MKKIMMALTLVACGALQANAQQSMPNYGKVQSSAMRGRTSASNFTSNRFRTGVYNSAVPRFNYSNVNRNLFQGAMATQPSAARSKPFSQVQRGPNTSPYMGLVADNPFTSTTTNYFKNVRPQIEQQQANDKLMAQNIKMQQQLQQLAAKPPYDPTGDEDRAPTGHSAVFQEQGGMYGNPGGYYQHVPIRSVRQGR
ncbi:hypothetical protein [Lacipirellula parvula]|uniref:Uncharacterized protein n=1 Tax=Lacipirellula parvula TaxID=2650471 RepID=A0A5K7X798_9BACT|nr:hypothetical protein [Lacipirellula parvula]BBO30601.1 hypothetical protein PLANPX_0213 [Lacipirellula parvula]